MGLTKTELRKGHQKSTALSAVSMPPEVKHRTHLTWRKRSDSCTKKFLWPAQLTLFSSHTTAVTEMSLSCVAFHSLSQLVWDTVKATVSFCPWSGWPGTTDRTELVVETRSPRVQSTSLCLSCDLTLVHNPEKQDLRLFPDTACLCSRDHMRSLKVGSEISLDGVSNPSGCHPWRVPGHL
jgi:hypothetical protein